MVTKNILILLLILLIVSSINGNANSNPIEGKKTHTTELNMDIFSFLRQLESNMPLTRQKITDMGFELTKIEKGTFRDDYSAPPMALNDGVRLRDITLSVRNVESGISLFLMINITNKTITPQEMEKQLGGFAVLHFDGVIVSGKTITYAKEVGEFGIFALYDQNGKDVLSNVSFTSVEPLEQ